jgi:L-lactate dehydrogenase complex protein LldG
VSAAREQILARIRAALGDVPAGERPDDVSVPRDYRRRGDAEPGSSGLIELLDQRLRDYHARVRLLSTGQLGAAVAAACAEQGLRRVAVPPELPHAWRPSGTDGLAVIEDHGLTARELDAVDVAVTGCAAAIAQTGTLVLDGQGVSGRRLLTLVPDHHICVVRPHQVVELVPEGIAALAPAVTDRHAPVTLISGPSATSDIELSRVEGVHGPRHLLVLIVDRVD